MRKLTAATCATVICLSGLFISPAVHAARPMITDDARITDAKACQLETWVQSGRNSTEYWALPSCNFTGNLELTFGGARTRADGTTRTTDVMFQGKTLFKTLEPNGWSWGLAAGNARHPDTHIGSGPIGNLYAYVPASFSFRDDRVLLHTNLGWLRDKGVGHHRHRMTWGIGSEAQLTERTWLIAETFGQGQGRPFFQAGFRYWLKQDRIQVDTTYGNRFGSGNTEERWFSIGLRLLSPAFLP
jgi:hypothetical protein